MKNFNIHLTAGNLSAAPRSIDENGIIEFSVSSIFNSNYKTVYVEETEFELFDMIGEACESTLFSSYINVDGNFYPCSFTENEKGWETGISVVEATDFNEVWFNSRTVAFRDKLLNMQRKCDCPFTKTCRHCPTFEVTNCHKTS